METPKVKLSPAQSRLMLAGFGYILGLAVGYLAWGQKAPTAATRYVVGAAVAQPCRGCQERFERDLQTTHRVTEPTHRPDLEVDELADDVATDLVGE